MQRTVRLRDTKEICLLKSECENVTSDTDLVHIIKAVCHRNPTELNRNRLTIYTAYFGCFIINNCKETY